MHHIKTCLKHSNTIGLSITRFLKVHRILKKKKNLFLSFTNIEYLRIMNKIMYEAQIILESNINFFTAKSVLMKKVNLQRIFILSTLS